MIRRVTSTTNDVNPDAERETYRRAGVSALANSSTSPRPPGHYRRVEKQSLLLQTPIRQYADPSTGFSSTAHFDRNKIPAISGTGHYSPGMSSLIAKVVSVQNDAREPSAHVVGIVFESGEPEPGATALSDFGASGLPLKGLSRFVPNKRYYLVTDGVPITVGDRLCVNIFRKEPIN
jgi:hypothetical protein